MSTNRTVVTTVSNSASAVPLPSSGVEDNEYEWYEIFIKHATVGAWLRIDGTAAAASTSDNEFIPPNTGGIISRVALGAATTVSLIAEAAGPVTVIIKGLQRTDLPVGVVPDPEDV